MIRCELSAISHITLQKGEPPQWYSVNSGCRVKRRLTTLIS